MQTLFWYGNGLATPTYVSVTWLAMMAQEKSDDVMGGSPFATTVMSEEQLTEIFWKLPHAPGSMNTNWSPGTSCVVGSTKRFVSVTQSLRLLAVPSVNDVLRFAEPSTAMSVGLSFGIGTASAGTLARAR